MCEENSRIAEKKQFLVIWTLSVTLALFCQWILYLSAPDSVQLWFRFEPVYANYLEAVFHIAAMNDTYLLMGCYTTFTSWKWYNEWNLRPSPISDKNEPSSNQKKNTYSHSTKMVKKINMIANWKEARQKEKGGHSFMFNKISNRTQEMNLILITKERCAPHFLAFDPRSCFDRLVLVCEIFHDAINTALNWIFRN